MIKANRDNLVKGEAGEQGVPGKNGTVSINPDTKMWQIDGKDTISKQNLSYWTKSISQMLKG